MQVIGRGLIANAFKKLNNKSNVIIFASGVSNSTCTDTNEFMREELLLKEFLSTALHSKKFIYFGTCSAYDLERKEDKYIIHKKNMEKLILTHSAGIICRLPQVVGKKANAATLIPYLFRMVYNREKINVWKHAYRNIIDVDNVVKTVDTILSKENISNNTYNIAAPRSTSIIELVNIIEQILSSQKFNVINKVMDDFY